MTYDAQNRLFSVSSQEEQNFDVANDEHAQRQKVGHAGVKPLNGQSEAIRWLRAFG